MNDRARVEWEEVFNDGEGCNEVDFLIMIHPKNEPSTYQLSDFTLKGERKATMKIDPAVNYIFQVIAREDKGSEYGIDYKYSDMVTSFTNGSSVASNSRSAPASSTRVSGANENSDVDVEALSPLQYDDYEEEVKEYDEKTSASNPWYI